MSPYLTLLILKNTEVANAVCILHTLKKIERMIQLLYTCQLAAENLGCRMKGPHRHSIRQIHRGQKLTSNLMLCCDLMVGDLLTLTDIGILCITASRDTLHGWCHSPWRLTSQFGGSVKNRGIVSKLARSWTWSETLVLTVHPPVSHFPGWVTSHQLCSRSQGVVSKETQRSLSLRRQKLHTDFKMGPNSGNVHKGQPCSERSRELY